MADDKPKAHDGYNEQQTLDCERLLVSLLRGLGPYREHVRLVGGLCPRYLCPAAPPRVPAHVGTTDVDLVVNILLLNQPEAYATLSQNLHRMGFKKGLGEGGRPVSWRWERRIEGRGSLLLEFLKDAGDGTPGRIETIPETGITALAIPHAAMVLDWFDVVDVTAELLDGSGKATETVRYADIVSFTCLKILAFNDRAARKDAADLEHVLRYFSADLTLTAARFNERIATGPHSAAARQCLDLLRKRFATTPEAQGWEKDGPGAAALFWLGDAVEDRDARIARQRNVAGLMEALLGLIR